MITLLSDWKLRDPYIAIFKGQLLKLVPKIQIMNISHNIEQFNFSQTAFIAKNSYSFFPKNTLHIILTGLSFSKDIKPMLVKYDDHFFLGEDTGVFSMMFGTKPKVETFQYNGDMLVTATEKLALMASWVLQGCYAKNSIPNASLKFQISMISEPDFNTDTQTVVGKIAYIDSKCNAITNIPVSMFELLHKKEFTALVSTVRPLKIEKYYPFYNSHDLDVVLSNNRLGFIEITMYNGNVAAIADLKVGNNVEIRFF